MHPLRSQLMVYTDIPIMEEFGSCFQSAAVFMGGTVALLFSTHFVSTELFLFSLFPHLLSIVSFVCYVCTQVGSQVLDEFRGSL